MDISDTLAPNSDQLDAVDLLSGPRIFTIAKVSKGDAEQPVNIHLVEFDRPWRPGKSMRRVLATCWGVDASAYIGRRVELFCDPDVRFGSEAVGGTRISRMSDIDKLRKIPLLVSRGKSATYTVEPLTEPTTAERIASLRAGWKTANPERRKVIESEVEALQAVASPVAPVADVTDAEIVDDAGHPFLYDSAADDGTCATCGVPEPDHA